MDGFSTAMSAFSVPLRLHNPNIEFQDRCHEDVDLRGDNPVKAQGHHASKGVAGSHDAAAGLVQGVRSEVMSHVIQRSCHESKRVALWEETSS
jgi:hypothetical protein